jgi:hypothetical protein
MLTEQTAYMPLYGAVLALQRVGCTWLLEVPESLRQRMQNILMQNSPRRGLSLYDESADLFVMHDWRRLARFAPGSSPVRSSGAPQAECAMPAPEEALATVVNEFGPFLASRGFTEVKLPANGSVGRHFVRRYAAHSLRLSFEDAARAGRAASEPPSGTGVLDSAVSRLSGMITVRRGEEILWGDAAGAAIERARRALREGCLVNGLIDLRNQNGHYVVGVAPLYIAAQVRRTRLL